MYKNIDNCSRCLDRHEIKDMKYAYDVAFCNDCNDFHSGYICIECENELIEVGITIKYRDKNTLSK